MKAAEQDEAMDVVEFFQQSAGNWSSQRIVHHLAFRRAEVGASGIQVNWLSKDAAEIKELCQQHEIDPDLAVGGSQVSWGGTMGWDREEEESHTGKTVFAIVPDEDDDRRGRLLRERGYAEIVPVVGRYHLDELEGLVLTTDYDTMSIEERFWFVNEGLRMRTSTVKRFGGYSTASVCIEKRAEASASSEIASSPSQGSSVFGW